MNVQTSVTRYCLMGALIVFMVGSVACPTPDPPVLLQPTPASPAATGTVEIDQDRNNNQIVTVQDDHLAPPQSINSEATTYVLWIHPIGTNDYINSGRLQIDNDRSAEIVVTTPFTDFEVFVTAETDAAVLHPSNSVVLHSVVADRVPVDNGD
ncbi:MAG: hypothetical protein ACNA8W_17690 [Bradymonadaceae bacterium]